MVRIQILSVAGIMISIGLNFRLLFIYSKISDTPCIISCIFGQHNLIEFNRCKGSINFGNEIKTFQKAYKLYKTTQDDQNTCSMFFQMLDSALALVVDKMTSTDINHNKTCLY